MIAAVCSELAGSVCLIVAGSRNNETLQAIRAFRFVDCHQRDCLPKLVTAVLVAETVSYAHDISSTQPDGLGRRNARRLHCRRVV